MIYKIFFITLVGLVGCSSVEKVDNPDLANPSPGHSDIQPPAPAPMIPRPVGDGALVGIRGNVVDLWMGNGDAAFHAGNYQDAIKQYRQIVELQKTAPYGRAAEALYKIGMSNELLGEDAKAIATYQDALKRKKDLTFELGEMEVPARLAMSYMRIGQMKTAKSYFLKAEKGIAKLRASLGEYKDKSAWLAQILYGMGFISSQIRNDKNFDDTIYSIQHAQNYLLFSLEINDPKWSPLAGQELEKLYKAAYDNLNEIKPTASKDSVSAKRQVQEKQKSMGFTLLDQLANLQDQILPEIENKYLKDTMARLAETEKEIEKLVKSRPVGEGLTDEAMKFENPKREGKIKDE